MELKTFVAQSIIQIAEGIKEAQAANTGARIAPKVTLKDSYQHVSDYPVTADHIPQKVSFDVAVTIAKDNKGNVGGGIQVLGMQFGSILERITKNSTISRIQFDIPLTWPESPPPLERPRDR